MGYDRVMTLKNIYIILKNHKYNKVQRIPLRKYGVSPQLLIHEGYNAFRFFSGKRNTFAVSLCPDLYESLFRKCNRNLFFLYKLFVKNDFVHKKDIIDLPLDELEDSGMLLRKDGLYKSLVRIVPSGKNIYFTDSWDRNIDNFTYLGYDSFVFSDLIKEATGGQKMLRGLDLCCGVGVLSLELASLCSSFIGVDCNLRAIEYARNNAEVNSISNVIFNEQDAFSFSEKEKFDLIVANPPFLDETSCPNNQPIDSYGGHKGIEFPLKLIQKALELFDDKGQLHLIARTYFEENQDQLLLGVHQLLDKNNSLSVKYTYLTTSCENSGDSKRKYYMVYILVETKTEGHLDIKKKNVRYRLSHFF